MVIVALLLQAATPACASPVVLPRLENWGRPGAGPGPMAVGQAYRVALVPVAGVTLAAKPGRAGTHAAVRSFTVASAGMYRVALDSGLWVDVVRDGRVLASSAHGHGPACSGIRKLVSFRLVPGRYVLQLSGDKAATATAMVAPGG